MLTRMQRLYALIALLVLIGGLGFGAYRQAEAGPGDQPVMLRAVGQDGTVRELVYVAQGAKTMANTTPVNSTAACGLGSYEVFKAQVVLVGTMTGTNPTLAIKWQNSLDGGATWADVGTWTTINATVTPASQSQTVSDLWNATTAVAYGDCWRAQYTFGGTGTVVANIGIRGLVEDHD